MFHRIATRSALTAGAALSIFMLPVAAKAQGSGATQSGAGAAAQPAQPPSRAQVSAQLDSNFKALDTNGDKVLNAAEIEAAQKREVAQIQATIGKRLDAEFAKLDSNKDGQLSLTEFKAAAPAPKVKPPTELLAQFDRNKDGQVSADEYSAAPLANFDRLDTNKDGTISAQEQSAARPR